MGLKFPQIVIFSRFQIRLFFKKGGVISGYLGRRKTILLLAPFVSLGYFLIGQSRNKYMLLVGRFLSTIAMTLHVSSEGKHKIKIRNLNLPFDKTGFNFQVFTFLSQYIQMLEAVW